MRRGLGTLLARWGALLLAALLMACGSSPPSHYYVLSAPADPPAVSRVGGLSRTIAIGAVRLPSSLDRPQIARQIGPNQLEYAESDRWAGPLDEMVRRVLAADLRALLPPGLTLVSDDSSAAADLTVAVEVSRFDGDKAGRVTLAATWETLGKNVKAVGAPREVNIVEPARGSDAAAVAATMSRALAGLAGNIAAGLGAGGAAAAR
jgi:hypothetical protein